MWILFLVVSGGFIWECPRERPRLHSLRRCHPRWRSAHACCPDLENRQRSADLNRDPGRMLRFRLVRLQHLSWGVRTTCTHPRYCSSGSTAPEYCSTLGCCSRCCLNWAHWTKTPVTMEMQAEVAVSHSVLWHGTPCRVVPHTNTDDTCCNASCNLLTLRLTSRTRLVRLSQQKHTLPCTWHEK